MKTLKAMEFRHLPKLLKDGNLLRNLFGCTIWAKSVPPEIKVYEKEVKRFKKMKEEGGVDKVAEVEHDLWRLKWLQTFMTNHNLDVIFFDMNREEYW